MKNFISFIKNITPISPESLDEILNILVEKKYVAKSKLCDIGYIPKKIYFLNSGIARVFLILPNGKEYTKTIYTKGSIMASFSALVENRPSLYAIECLTDCDVIECDYSQFNKLSENNIDIAIYNRKYLEIMYLSYINRNNEFLILNATQRYLNLRKVIPEIDSLISQKTIASHLAITPIQLSRIRKNIN